MMLRNRAVRRFGLALIITLLLSSTLVNVAGAATRDGLHLRVTCAGFYTNNGGVILDRDNTGAGREAIYITATDALGNGLFTSAEMTFAVGGRMYFADGTFFAFAAAPTTNPITVSVISPAGNGFEAQTIYAVRGYCGDLAATITEAGDVMEGMTSPSVPLNAPPPEGVNPEGIGREYAGYLIVNTARLNLRSGDGPEYTIVGRVSGGTELIVLGVNEARSWWYVEVGGLRGWVHHEYVINRGDLRAVPIVEARGELLPPRFYVYADSMLYGLPGEVGALCEIAGKLEYEIVGQSRTGASIAIEAVCNDQTVTGWLLAEYGAIRNAGVVEIPVLDY